MKKMNTKLTKILMALILFLRRTLFWIPHPIGLIMLVNPIMGAYWFSLLLGWAAKALVSKYGGKQLYAKTRGFFLGLICGELVIVALAMWFSNMYGVPIGIDLNRN